MLIKIILLFKINYYLFKKQLIKDI
jgi:hypothetical protein